MKNWFLVIFWAGLIFFFSHQANLDSGLPGFWDHLFSKSAHFFEYAVLAFLLIRALSGAGLSQKKIIVLTLFLALGYALTDEYHQSFIPGREVSGDDILTDALGIGLAVWLFKRKMIKY